METMTVQLYERDFSISAPERFELQVDRLTWKDTGGPAVAQLSGAAPDESWGIQAAQWSLDALRRPVEIRDWSGEMAWWGYVHRVEVQQSPFNLTYDLAELANRVCVEYWRREPQLEWTGVKTFTPWLDDLESQRMYGVKERIYRLGSIHESEALQACNALLAGHSRPLPHLSASDSRDKGVRIRLECRGWWETLSWRTAHFTDGYEGFVRPAQATQTLGRNATADAKVAQSFQAGYGDWKAGEVVVNIRAVGQNSDALRCELCADASGLPGSVLASAEVSSAIISGARWWVKFLFSAGVPMEANRPYWLVLSRTGPVNSANYYQLYLDGSNGYPNGKSLTWNGSSWLDPTAGQGDINFYVVGYVTRLARLSELAGTNLGGQFLSGLRVNTAIDGDTLLWREGIRDCAEEWSNLLHNGGENTLTARVDSSRRLVVEAVPGAEGWLFSLDRDGVLRARSGRPALPSDQPDGQRVLLSNGWDGQRPVMTALEWTPGRGLQVTW